MITIIRGSSNKPISSQHLVDYFEQRSDLEGILYLGYPIIGSVDGSINIDAMLVSPSFGMIIFDLVEGINFEDRTEIRDDLYTKIYSKLIDYKSLSVRRKLQVKISVATYASGWSTRLEDEPEVVTSHEALDTYLSDITWQNNEYYRVLLQAIQAVTNIKSTPKRENVTKPNSKGAILKSLEDSIANLDSNQSAAVIETSDSVQRIRGLAGSGKTIVLALKVAYLHSKNPEWNIAVTFNTRSLKKQFEDLITRFTYEHKRDKPDWDKIKIMQGWGSPSNKGIYYEVCKQHDIEYFDYTAAKNAYEGSFAAVCRKALSDIQKFIPMYDVILIDEAQDFSREFLTLCYEILTPPKRLIFAYDELQTLSRNSMPPTEEIFGCDERDRPRVVLRNERNKPKQDIILRVCYRNSRPVLATAHALGFGVYREDGMVQMFGDKSLWLDVGYQVIDGALNDGEKVKLGRNADSSPEFLENHSPIDDLIQFKCFEDVHRQEEWIVQEIYKNLTQDELRPQDIMVVHTDPLTTQDAVGNMRRRLFEMGINTHLAGAANPDLFNKDDSVTFTGIYRAKGNEAGMVYVINAQNCYSGMELSKKRNILFTAITRSKGWVRVTGYGEDMLKLTREYQETKDRNFELHFTYPTADMRKKMNIIHRDMTRDEKRFVESSIENLTEIVKAIRRKEIYLEDLPQELREALKVIFDE
ncbi:ATP-binding domain-containing protein [Brevibacillus humidisoli]|uniref:DEAD/DEAH box helicase n=1 Tax=Brevibacillus humidisoli TaxID=2895522 RepID=UPI001E3C2CB0|nr:ATP-binding domain-containing protein [Brevibacillus humidisoli]UFJ41361.1 ATP-binding domain-containing protein [Brevibacillus humidisoli]